MKFREALNEIKMDLVDKKKMVQNLKAAIDQKLGGRTFDKKLPQHQEISDILIKPKDIGMDIKHNFNDRILDEVGDELEKMYKKKGWKQFFLGFANSNTIHVVFKYWK